MLAFVGFLSEFLFIPKEYLFYTMRTGALVAIIFFLLEFLCIFLLIINFFSHKKGKRIVDIIKPFFKKLWYVLIALNLAMFYFIASSILIISSDKIVNRSILNPRGEQYNYSDIETIRIGMKEDTFYYTLYMRDSKTINLTELGTISDMVDSDNELSYLVKIDKIAMDAGAVKVVSDVDFNNSFYDETGIVNIEKIINNK